MVWFRPRSDAGGVSETREKLQELLSHRDRAMRAQGAELLKVMPEADVKRVIAMTDQLEGVDLSGIRAHQVLLLRIMHDCDFSRADLTSAFASGRELERFTGVEVILKRAFLNNATLRSVTIPRAVLDGADLTESLWKGVFGAGLRAHGLKAPWCRIVRASLPDADLTGADFTGTDLTDTWFVHAYLHKAHLPQSAPEGGWRAGPGARLDSLIRTGGRLPDLSLSGSRIQEVGLGNIDLIGADFSRSHIAAGHMVQVALRGANLQGLTAGELILRHCDLSGADLRGISPDQVVFESCTAKPQTRMDVPLKGLRLLNTQPDPDARQTRFVVPSPTGHERWLTDAAHIPGWPGMHRFPGTNLPELRHRLTFRLALCSLLIQLDVDRQALLCGPRLEASRSQQQPRERWSVLVGSGRRGSTILNLRLPSGLDSIKARAMMWKSHSLSRLEPSRRGTPTPGAWSRMRMTGLLRRLEG